MAIVKYIKGSILDAEQKYIAHGVNCQNAMRSGVAKVLFDKYPKIKDDYHLFCGSFSDEGYTSKDLLGFIDISYCGDHIVVNAFTQHFYGRDDKKYINYDAIFTVFKRMVSRGISEIAIPKIGAGLAGGNWEVISRIIDDATGDDLDVYVYYLED
jgi:O-acetyl-ADP-ribose deacetylase (regulator of RNase III)